MCNYIFSFCFSKKRFINARRRIVQPMIDQSNRAGKLPVNGSDPRNDVLTSSSTPTKQNKRSTKSRELISNDRNSYHRTSPVSAPVIYQQLSPLYIPKGKSVHHRSNIHST